MNSFSTAPPPKPTPPAPILVMCDLCGWRAEHRACLTDEAATEAIGFLRRLLITHFTEQHREAKPPEP